MTDQFVADRVVDMTRDNVAFGQAPVVGTIADLCLRDATDADSQAMIALVQRVWSEYPGKRLNVGHDMPELQAVASSYRALGGRAWVIERDREIVASVAYRPSAVPGTVELQKLYVAGSERRHGLGNTLCALVEDEARRQGAATVELWSDVKLRDAHRLYEARGYRRGEAVKTYDDTSGTVRCYYSKALADVAVAEPRWIVRPARARRG